MKKIIYMAVLLPLLLGGCSTFRALFDESPEETQAKKERVERAKKARAERGDGEDSVFSFTPMKRKDPEAGLKSSLLSPEEQTLMEREESGTFGRSVEAEEMRKIRSRDRKRSEENSDFVFGGGVKDWF